MNQYSKNENNFYISDSFSLKFFNGEIIFTSSSSFYTDYLKTKKQILIDALSDFYKSPINIKIILSDNIDDNSSNQKHIQNNINNSLSKKEDNSNIEIINPNYSPVEQLLVKLFSAKEVI